MLFLSRGIVNRPMISFATFAYINLDGVRWIIPGCRHRPTYEYPHTAIGRIENEWVILKEMLTGMFRINIRGGH